MEVTFDEPLSFDESRVAVCLLALEVDASLVDMAFASGRMTKQQRSDSQSALRKGYGDFIAGWVGRLADEVKDD